MRDLREPVHGSTKGFIDTALVEKTNLKEFLLMVLNERDGKYQSQFQHLDQQVGDASLKVKDALVTANGNIASALASLDRRFDSVNEFRAQLNDQQEYYARKEDMERLFQTFKEATVKSENAMERRFESVNEFRAQMADMQATLAGKSEVDIRFDALNAKVDAASGQLRHNSGRDSGLSAAWSILIASVGVVAVVVSLFLKK